MNQVLLIHLSLRLLTKFKKIQLESFRRQRIHEVSFYQLPIQNVIECFLNKLKEAKELLEQRRVDSSVTDELRKKQHIPETSELDKKVNPQSTPLASE